MLKAKGTEVWGRELKESRRPKESRDKRDYFLSRGLEYSCSEKQRR